MKEEVFVEIEGIVKAKLRRSLKARYVNISIKAPGNVTVSVPKGLAFEKAEKILRSRIDWVKKHLERLNNNVLNERQGTNLFLPKDTENAKEKICSRLIYLMKVHGFNINRLSFRNQKTRWGSCSRDDNISLNLRIADLPDNLMDYILLHELVHTRHKNHGSGFWAELGRYINNLRQTRKELKKYHIC